MLEDISGNWCVSCARYTQYYATGMTRSGSEMQAINCSYCGQFQRTTRPESYC